MARYLMEKQRHPDQLAEQLLNLVHNTRPSTPFPWQEADAIVGQSEGAFRLFTILQLADRLPLDYVNHLLAE